MLCIEIWYLDLNLLNSGSLNSFTWPWRIYQSKLYTSFATCFDMSWNWTMMLRFNKMRWDLLMHLFDMCILFCNRQHLSYLSELHKPGHQNGTGEIVVIWFGSILRHQSIAMAPVLVNVPGKPWKPFEFYMINICVLEKVLSAVWPWVKVTLLQKRLRLERISTKKWETLIQSL